MKKKALIILTLLFLFSIFFVQADMSYDTKLEHNEDSTNPVTDTYTVGAGADLLVLCIMTKNVRNAGTPTYGGTDLVEVASPLGDTGGEGTAEMWYLVDPTTESPLTISVPNAGTEEVNLIVSSYSATGSNSVAVDDTDQNSGTSANPSITSDPTVDGVVIVDCLFEGYKDVIDANSDQLLYSRDTGNEGYAAQYYLQSTAAQKVMSYTQSSDDWQMIATAFKESAANNVPSYAGIEPTNNTGFSNEVTFVTLNATANDGDGGDTLEVSFVDASDDSKICTNTSVSPGTGLSCLWSGLSSGNDYQWYVNVSDGTALNTSGDYNFSIAPICTTPVSGDISTVVNWCDGTYTIATGNVTLRTGGKLYIRNVNLTLSEGRIYAEDQEYHELVINNSLIQGENSTYNQVYIRRRGNFTIINSTLRDLKKADMYGQSGDPILKFEDSTFYNMNDDGFSATSTIGGRMDRITIYDVDGDDCLSVKTDKHWIINNTEIYDCADDGVYLYSHSINMTFENLNIHDVSGHCFAADDSNFTTIRNMTSNNCTNYGIDFLGYGNNQVVYDSNVNDAEHGIMFSMGDGGVNKSFNLSSWRNTVGNVSGYGIYWTSANTGGSHSDFIDNATERGIGMVTDVYNINVTDAYITDCPQNSVFLNNGVYDLDFSNVTIVNENVSWYINDAHRLNIKNITLEDQVDYLVFGSTASTIINISSYHNFFMNMTSVSNLKMNISATNVTMVATSDSYVTFVKLEAYNDIKNMSNGKVIWDQTSYTVFIGAGDVFQVGNYVNNIPYYSGAEPVNNTELEAGITFATLNITANDDDIDLLTVTFYNASNDVAICTNTSTASGSKVSCLWSSLSNTDNQWYVILDDSQDTNTTGDYNFSIDNYVPYYSGAEPTNNTQLGAGTTFATLNLTVNDGDSDPMTVTFYNASNDVAICTNTSIASGTEVHCLWDSLSGWDHQWYVILNDGMETNTTGDYNFSIFVNTIPTIAVTDDLASGYYGNQTLSVNVTPSDINLDTLSVNATWWVDGIINFSELKTGISSGTLTEFLLGEGNFSNNQLVNVSFFANDGTDNSTLVWSSQITIDNYIPNVTLIDDLSGTYYTNSTMYVNVTPTDADLDTLSLNATWYVDGVIAFSELKSSIASGTKTQFILGDGNFSKGELVNVSIFANDGTDNSTLLWSSQVTIGNLAPNISVTDDLSGTFYTNSTLSINVTPSDIDGDTLSINITWYVDGGINFSELKTGINSGTLTEFLLGSGNFSKGELVNTTVFSNDGTDNSTLVWSSQITIGNTAPTVVVTDDLSGTPDPDVDLDINVTPSDIDGDTLSVNVTWYVDSSIVFSELKSSIASGTLTQFILGSGNFSQDQKINATVFANDGTDNSTLVWSSQVTAGGNNPPTVAVTDDLSGTYYTNSTMYINVTPTDLDLENVDINATWYVDSVIIFSEKKSNIASGTKTQFILGEGNFSKGELVNVSFFANDSTEDGALVWSSQVTIANLIPNISITDDLSGTYYSNSTLSMNVTPGDPDGDTLSVNVTWYVDGSIAFSELKSSIAPDTLTEFLLGSGNFSNNQVVNATVFSNDGTDNSTLIWSSQITIDNYVPVVAVTDDLVAGYYGNQTLSVNVTPTDGDADTLSVNATWYVDSVIVYSELKSSIASGTLTEFLLGEGNFSNNQLVNVSFFANDGTEDGSIVWSSQITIDNYIPNVTLTDDLSGTYYTNSTMYVNVTPTDGDADTLSVNATWNVDGVIAYSEVRSSVASGTLTQFNLSSGNFSKAELVNVSIFANDGTEDSSLAWSSQITVSNLAPAITVTNDLAGTPDENTDLDINVTPTDTDGDTLSINITWYVDGGINFSELKTGIASGTLTQFILGSGNFSNGEKINATIFSNDGTDNSTLVWSSQVTATGNNAPTVAVTDDLSGTYYTNSTMYINVTPSDTDLDTLSVNATWNVDSVVIFSELKSSIASGTLTQFILGSGNFSKGELVNVSFFANDGKEDGALVWSSQITIANLGPIVVESFPSITLDHNENLSVQWNVTDPDSDSLTYDTNSTLISINGSGYVSDNPAQTDEGIYSIMINSTDGTDTVTNNWIYTIINDDPEINLTYPGNNTNINDTFTIIFNYSGRDNESDDLTCSFNINEILNATNSSISSGSVIFNRVSFGYSSANYNWSVNCSDGKDMIDSGINYFNLTDNTPSTPTGFGYSSDTSSITVSWDANSESDIEFYYLYIATIEAGPYTLQNYTIGLSYKLSGLAEGVNRYWKLSAKDYAGSYSANTSILSSITQETPVSSGSSGGRGKQTIKQMNIMECDQELKLTNEKEIMLKSETPDDVHQDVEFTVCNTEDVPITYHFYFDEGLENYCTLQRNYKTIIGNTCYTAQYTCLTPPEPLTGGLIAIRETYANETEIVPICKSNTLVTVGEFRSIETKQSLQIKLFSGIVIGLLIGGLILIVILAFKKRIK